MAGRGEAIIQQREDKMRIMVMSDLHCGHRGGLTPPPWHGVVGTGKREEFNRIKREAWEWYSTSVEKNGPFDLVVVNGDAIDGRGEASGGTELDVIDREEQCEMAEFCIREAMGKGTKVIMTYGTAYHSGKEEDWEHLIASSVNAEKIGSHEWVSVGGSIFDFKHHVGGSTIPHGRHTAIARDALWSKLWADSGLQPKTDVLVRSHVHYFQYCGDPHLGLRMTTPALQVAATKYGARRCSGLVDFGFVVFDVSKSGLAWHEVLGKVESAKPEAIVLDI